MSKKIMTKALDLSILYSVKIIAKLDCYQLR